MVSRSKLGLERRAEGRKGARVRPKSQGRAFEHQRKRQSGRSGWLAGWVHIPRFGIPIGSCDAMSGTKLLADNRRARYDYFVSESLEVGMVLVGTEVKSMKSAQFSFNDAWVELDNAGELWIRNLHVNTYKMAGLENHDPDRKKKLLAHKAEVKKLRRQVDEKGFTLIPLDFHLKEGRIKVTVGLCKGKKQYDKRESIKEKDQKRDLDRELRRS